MSFFQERYAFIGLKKVAGTDDFVWENSEFKNTLCSSSQPLLMEGYNCVKLYTTLEDHPGVLVAECDALLPGLCVKREW